MNRLTKIIWRNLFHFPGMYLRLSRYAKDPDRYPAEERYEYVLRFFRRVVRTSNVQLQIFGQENIPQEGGFMFYGNHQGIFDILAISLGCQRPFSAVYKKEMDSIPFLKQIFRSNKCLPLDRDDVRQSLSVIQEVTHRVENGEVFLIFPEGTRSKNTNQMGQFHGGSFRCAIKAKCPVVPVAYVDCFKVLDQPGSEPVTVQIHFLKAIPYEEFAEMKPLELAQLVKDRIQAALDEYAPQET